MNPFDLLKNAVRKATQLPRQLTPEEIAAKALEQAKGFGRGFMSPLDDRMGEPPTDITAGERLGRTLATAGEAIPGPSGGIDDAIRMGLPMAAGGLKAVSQIANKVDDVAEVAGKAAGKVDDYVYHTTSPEVLESIFKTGLKPSAGQYGEGVYFAPSVAETGGYGSAEGALLRAKKTDLPAGYQEFPEQGWVNSNVAPETLEVSKDMGKTWGKLGDMKVFYPGILKSEKSLKLPPEQSAIETKFLNHLQSDIPKAVMEYKLKFGKVLNTDNVRELSEDYSKAKSTLSAAVHEPASAFTKYLYKEALAEPPKSGVVMFTGGGTGAGKTSSLVQHKLTKRILDESDIVYDTNLATFDSSVEKINQALESGRRVIISYTHGDPVKAFDQMVGRAVSKGRTVPLQEHAKTHVGAPKTIVELFEHYKDDPKVKFVFIDNTYGKGESKLKGVDFMRKIAYNKEDLEKRFRGKLQNLFSKGLISKEIYDGIKGQ